MKDKLRKLLSLCKCSVTIEVNNHKDYYQTAEEALVELAENFPDNYKEINEDVKKIMMDTDTIIYLHFYPNTPIGFNYAYHYDLDVLLDWALECIKED